MRIRANYYATGHWRCRVYVPAPGDDPDLERNVVIAYTNGAWFDIFRDGRTEWDAASLAGELERRARGFDEATRSDPDYAAWLREVRERTGGGYLSFCEDFYTVESDYSRRGLVKLIHAGRRHGAIEEDLIGVPPAP